MISSKDINAWIEDRGQDEVVKGKSNSKHVDTVIAGGYGGKGIEVEESEEGGLGLVHDDADEDDLLRRRMPRKKGQVIDCVAVQEASKGGKDCILEEEKMGVGRFSGSRAWSPAQGITLTLGIMFLLSALFSPTAQANGLNMIDGGLDEMEAVEIGQDADMTSFISQSATGEDYDAAEQRKKGVRGLSLVRVRSSSNEAINDRRVTANEGIDEKDFAIVGEDGNSVLNPTNQQMGDIVIWDAIARSDEDASADSVHDDSKTHKSDSKKKKHTKDDPCPCQEPDHLCMSHGDHLHCRRGIEFSKKCKNDSECFSGSCHENLYECWCPTPDSCTGCSNNAFPCLRVEHQSTSLLDLSALKASAREGGKKEKYHKLDLFDAGKTVSVVPYHNENAGALLPPTFLQASALTKDNQHIGQVVVKCRRDPCLGLQIFIDNDWITHIGDEDLPFSSKKQKSKASDKQVDIVKNVYPRIFIESLDELRNEAFVEGMRGKTAVARVLSDSVLVLDFDLPPGMGVEFVGEINSTISVIGNVQSLGRASFKNTQVSFEQGSLNIKGPLIFQSSQLLGLDRCPLFFIEYNSLCFFVSRGIEQAHDAEALCGTYGRASLASVNDVKPFLQDNTGALNRHSKAWVKPVASGCMSVDSNGIVYNADQLNCDTYVRVVCSLPLKEPIHGKRYTSYNTTQFVGTYDQDLFKRIVDKTRLPFQLGGSLSFVQGDLIEDDDSETKIPILLNASDSFPTGVSVSLTLHSGSLSSIEIALDTHNGIGHEGFEWSIDDDTNFLPTKIQLHTGASVCIQRVDLLVHNENDHGSVVASLPANLFADCLNYNVCTSKADRLCGRSLMYYDEINKCARLDGDNSSIIPRDLSIDLLALSCARLTTWHHPSLGSPFLVEAHLDDLSEPVQVNEYFGDSHQYSFYNTSTFAHELDESTVLPVEFLVKGSAILQAVKITRYGRAVSEVDFPSLRDCINMCNATANVLGLRLNSKNATTLNLIADIECRKLIQVLAEPGSDGSVIDGRDACTSPPISVGSLDDVVRELELITQTQSEYRTLTLNVTSRLNGNTKNILVPTNRGLILYEDLEVPEGEGSIESAIFHVADLAELFLVDLNINGTTRIFSKSLAQVEITGSDISTVKSSEPFLTNEGETSFSSVSFFLNATLLNVNNGRIECMFVHFYDRSAFVNSPEGSIRLSRINVYEQFSPFLNSAGYFEGRRQLAILNPLPDDSFGTLELPDAKRFYESVDDDTDVDCFGVDIPDKIFSDVGVQKCEEKCEEEFMCSGFITFYEDLMPQCGLCLKEHCSFNCTSAVGGAYFKARSKFHYSKASVCPYISRPFKSITGATLEECKVYCSYYRSCEGFRVTNDHTSCELIADLDFAEECYPEDSEEIYFPFLQGSTDGYYNVNGELASPFAIAKHPGIPVDECSNVCSKTISCSSFQVSDDKCHLYKGNNFVRTSGDTGLYVSIDDAFPKKRYMGYESCYLPDAYDTVNKKTVERCKNLCNEDYSCFGFTFRPVKSLSEENCELYNRTALVNGVFGPNLGCQRQPSRREQRDILPRRLGKKKKNASRKKKNKNEKESNYPSLQPSLSSNPSNEPSLWPSMSTYPSLLPSPQPSVSIYPSGEPSVSPSSVPSGSNVPSTRPSLSIRPSQESETYDLFVTFAKEVYSPSTDRAFELVRNVTELVEDECKALCFYDSQCIAIRYDVRTSICQIGTLSFGNSTENPFLALESMPADETARYASSNACFIGEKLQEHEDERMVAEESSGYFHLPRTCTLQTTSKDASLIKSPAECGMECSEIDSCIGFIYFVNYGGTSNVDKFHMCEKISSFDLGKCDAVDNNMDLYLRGDIGATCQAVCNVHQLCSAFTFSETVCELYSDIALLDHCPKGESPQKIQIGLSNRARDALVAAPGQCFVEYEDLRPLGCRDFAQPSDLSGEHSTNEMLMLTPYKCQQSCKEERKEYYAVHDGKFCKCGSSDMLKLQIALNQKESCSIPCTGDTLQSCGGNATANVGETGLPILDLTLSQCKSECFLSQFCEAILFDDSAPSSSCELQSNANFETCPSSESILYIESLEHYYLEPRTSYIGSKSIYNATTYLKQDCQKLCDAFHSCEAIKYNDISHVLNCELLGGEVIGLEEDDIAEGVQVAHDVTLYTSGFSPDLEKRVTHFDTTFDLDECRTLCDQHVLCGSLVFMSHNCTLYNKDAFADISNISDSSRHAPHYIGYSYFVDPDQDFTLANGLCVDSTSISITSRKTTLSAYDCATRCNSVSSCVLFSYKNDIDSCVLYGIDTQLTSDCTDKAITYVMFSRSRFAEKENACLKNEESTYRFSLKKPYECAALCDKWFNCRSFRIDEMSGICQLFESEQYSEDYCKGSSLSGKLYVYNSDYRFTRLDRYFCVTGVPIISKIESAPIEACKSMCDKLSGCLSFQHTQDGSCFLYDSADFSGKCSEDEERDLYITYRDVVEPKSRFLFNELDTCFKQENNQEISTKNEQNCKEECELLEDCFGIQTNNITCTILDVNTRPIKANCTSEETKAFLKTKVNPYKKLDKTCLQKRISFGDGKGLIRDKEDYECMALCNMHPFCRYFLYGDTAESQNPEFRECILFEAQSREVDDCKDPIEEPYNGLTEYVNGRTFIDQITWFGEPEENFAILNGISYQECASLCDSVKDCNAFVHTWNYRRAPLSADRPRLFTKTRITRLDFDVQDHRALFLNFDHENSRLLLSPAVSDDDERKQQVSPEITGDDKFKLKFWSSSGKCLSGGTHKQLNASTTLTVIQDNFDGASPVCQKLSVSDCSDDNVVQFRTLDGVDSVINLDYEFYTRNQFNTTKMGCVRLRRTFDNDINATSSNGGLRIPPVVNCTSSYQTEVCNLTVITLANSTDDSEESTNTTTGTGSCETSNTQICTNSPNSTVEDYFETTVTTTICKQTAPTECTHESDATDTSTNITTKVQHCDYTTTVNETVCWSVQKSAKDLLEEIYSFFHEADECNPISEDPMELFSSTFSGKGCKFDNETATFPSQEFSFASDGVILQNKGFESGMAHCLNTPNLDLNEALKLEVCSDDFTIKWVYLFSFGQLFYTDKDNNMICLTVAEDDSPKIESCDRSNLKQRWDFKSDKGTISSVKKDGTNDDEGCLIVTDTGEAKFGNCTDPTSRWSRFEVCKLNTREKTGEMNVESTQKPGECISNDATLETCSSGSAKWIYYYDGNRARLQLADTNDCLGRQDPDGNYMTSDGLHTFPTGIVRNSCDNVERSPFTRMVIGGKEHNVFQWSLIETTGDKEGRPILPYYCVDIPQSQQEVCPDLTSAPSWRKYGNALDATEISVKPSATLQDITDPEVLFQFYLFSAEGKASRVLRSRMAALVRDVERAKVLIKTTTTIIAEATNILDAVQPPMDAVNVRLEEGKKSFKLFSTIARPLELIPYVGQVVKAIKIRSITGQLSKLMKRGQTAVDKVYSRVEKSTEPLQEFQNSVSRVEDTLPTIYAIELLVDMITRSSYCAYRESNDEHYELTQTLIKVLASKVSITTNMLDGISNPLSSLNRFKADINLYLLKPIRGFNSILDPFFEILDGLAWLKAILTFTISVPLPKVRWKKICFPFYCFKIPSLDFSTQNLSLEILGNLVKKVIDVLKSIPFVGHLITEVENLIDMLLNEIFKTIGIELPSFEIEVPFLDNLEDLVEKAREELQQFIDTFEDVINMDGKIFNLIDPILSAVSEAIPTIPTFNLDDLGISISNTTFPVLSVGDIDFKLPDIMISIKTGLLDSIEDIKEDIRTLFDKVECSKYETVRINVPEFMKESLNISQFPLPACPINTRVCTGLHMEGLEDFSAKTKTRIDDIVSRRRRELASDSTRSLSIDDTLCLSNWADGVPANGGISIPIPIKDIFTTAGEFLPRKLFQLFDKSPPDSFLKGGRESGSGFFFDATLEIPESVSLKLGCNNGEFQASFFVGPMISLTIGKKSPLEPTTQANKEVEYLQINEDWTPEQKEKGRKDGLIKFREEAANVELITKILCHLDFIWVTEKLWESFEKIALPYTTVDERNWFEANRGLGYGPRATPQLRSFTRSTLTRIEPRLILNFNKGAWKEDEKYYSEQQKYSVRHRNIFLKLLAEINSRMKSNEQLNLVYPEGMRSTEDDCGQLYDIGSYQNTDTVPAATAYAKALSKKVIFHPFSWTRLSGPPLPISSKLITMDSSFKKKKVSKIYPGYLMQLIFNRGFAVFQRIMILIDAIEKCKEGCTDADEIAKTKAIVEFTTYLMPRLEVKWIYDFLEREKSSAFTGNPTTLLDAMFARLDDTNINSYTQQKVTEFTFKFVSLNINLVRDEESNTEVYADTAISICGGRFCFFPFSNDPRGLGDFTNFSSDEPSVSPSPST